MSRQVYFEHDKRAPTSNIYRPPGAMGRQRKYNREPFRGLPGGKSRLLDMDGDIEMSGPNSSNVERRFNPYGQRSHNNKNKHKKQQGNKSRNNRQPQHDDSQGTWYRISIPYGKKSGKTFIIKSLASLCKTPFVPFNFQFVGNQAEFYINVHATARELRDMNRRITTPDGFKMAIHMSKCPQPNAMMDAESLESLKAIMSAKYDAISHTLNLSKFHMDETMRSHRLYLPLNKSIVFTSVAKIIIENIPEIETLNLSNNKLYSVDALSSLVPVCKQLKSVVLQNNKLRGIVELNSMKGLDLIELVLDGNPLCDLYKDKTTYISAVRERFPKLLNLDGTTLPAPIGFDLGVSETCPQSKKSFLDAHEKDLVIQFLDQYYTIYDSGDRSKLLDAYHDQANFSLCLSKHSQPNKSKSGSFAAYSLDNRNLLNITDGAQRFKLLKQGKLAIVSALSELPQTMHDPTSFSIDIFFLSHGLMCFSVIGVFKEVGAEINNATLKTFSRTFVVVAQGQGFVIANETLFIAHASNDQQAKAFKVPAPTPSPSPAPTDEKSPAEKQLMVTELSKQSGMNFDFSTKCLEENDWDYPRAVAVFLKFQSEGKLPPEAFMPTML